jgi:hypothetical protein
MVGPYTRFEVRNSEFKSERLSFEQMFSLSQNKLPHMAGTNVITVRLYYKNVKILKVSHGTFVLTALGRTKHKKQWVIRFLSYK